MDEKWSVETEWTDDGRRFARVALKGEPLSTNEVVAALNALEADKAVFLEALERALPYIKTVSRSDNPGYEEDPAGSLYEQMKVFLSRIRSEGAEVKAGE